MRRRFSTHFTTFRRQPKLVDTPRSIRQKKEESLRDHTKRSNDEVILVKDAYDKMKRNAPMLNFKKEEVEFSRM
ncbi:hypothetical protein TSUD_55480 [Trifolium subterraneum]|uniref:Uncharacterized protein n=1 Tax=Trifolium subterraneum TaxID=3900 RepID=A0A2Z6M802_TRISU|nr:hypothetical protein TSUD_55480 [Trifolium subterraneum]